MKKYENELRKCYRNRNFTYAWFKEGRWLPVTSEGDYIAVNLPEFKMHVYHADSLLWSCNAVVGQTTHPTTLFYIGYFTAFIDRENRLNFRKDIYDLDSRLADRILAGDVAY